MLSDEMQEMHLTPQGWVAGNARYDDKTRDEYGCPADAVLTIRREVVAASIGQGRATQEESALISDHELIKELKNKFGAPPFCV